MCAWGAPQIAIDFWTSQNDCHGTSGFANHHVRLWCCRLLVRVWFKLPRTHHLFIF